MNQLAPHATRGPCAPGARLPPLRLPRADGGGDVALRAGLGRGSVVHVVPDPEDAAARRYRERLEAERGMLARWRARLVLLHTGGVVGARGGDPRIVRLVDDRGMARRRLGLSPAEGAVLIADEWGMIYAAECSPDVTGLPDVEEISDWLRFIATQCPECGVPDEPGRGEWESG